MTVQATSTGADATLAGIARLVADAQVYSNSNALLFKISLALLDSLNTGHALSHRSNHTNQGRDEVRIEVRISVGQHPAWCPRHMLCLQRRP